MDSVWVSLPYLPIHFIHCKEALYSIAVIIGKPLFVDYATASVNKPSVARVLVEYRDCNSCKHLGHSADTCYVANPSLWKLQKPVD